MSKEIINKLNSYVDTLNDISHERFSTITQCMEQAAIYIAELEQQNAELSKDKGRLDWLIKTKSYIDKDDVFYYVLPKTRPNGATVAKALGAGKSERQAIDAAIAKEQEHE